PYGQGSRQERHGVPRAPVSRPGDRRRSERREAPPERRTHPLARPDRREADADRRVERRPQGREIRQAVPRRVHRRERQEGARREEERCQGIVTVAYGNDERKNEHGIRVAEERPRLHEPDAGAAYRE